MKTSRRISPSITPASLAFGTEDATPSRDWAFAVVTAAGSGMRLGADCPKALVELAGRTLVSRAVAAMFAHPAIAGVVVTAPVEELPRMHELFAADAGVLVVAGGAERQDSVRLGLEGVQRLAAELELELHEHTPILIHDAARPLTPVEVVDRVVAAVRDGADGVIPAVPVSDTLVQVGAEVPSADVHYSSDPTTVVVDLVPRDQVRAVQTPQGFGWGVISRAHREGEGVSVTDDATLVRRIGGVIRVCAGSADSLKVTTPFDLAVAEVVLSRRYPQG